DQWQVDFRPRIAYWWSRSWDVLVVDPRGSTGHGRTYQRALNGAWGRLDVDDTAVLISAAHTRGWARPATTVAIGGSSGGLSVLGLLADHGHLVAGGVTSYPVSDLRALTQVTHRFEAHYTDTLVGPLDRGADRYAELSPINRADRITGPLLVFHGTDDPVVPIGQSDELVARVRAGGGSVDYVVYDGEAHGFRDPANQRDEYERTERFLDALVPHRNDRGWDRG
ncbi:MAG TPA: prolyl oligopeptidase family serine peptidase, partial [Jiangellaceae bacterium]|nr:prolyl oligopeptidase family serine peptidase [Jiangellaceae bacterium]